MEQLQDVPAVRASSCRPSSPNVDMGTAGGFLQLLFVRVRRLSSRGLAAASLRRRLGIGRDVGPPRDGAGHAARRGPVGAGGRDRRLRERRRSSWRSRRPASASASSPPAVTSGRPWSARWCSACMPRHWPGSGMAVGGLFGPRVAATVVVAFVVVTWFVELAGPATSASPTRFIGPRADHSLRGSRWSAAGTRSGSSRPWRWRSAAS